MKMLLIGEDDEPGTLVAAAVACVRDGENLIVIGRGDVQRIKCKYLLLNSDEQLGKEH
jgi:hypothetical protein